MDKIIFTGRLGADPEKRTSNAGNEYVRLNVAVTHYDKDRQKTTEWRQVTVFGKTGEYCGNYLKKGDMVTVEGYPSPRAYTPKSGGDPVGVIDVRAESVDAGGNRGGSDQSQGGQEQPAQTDAQTGMTQVNDEELPF